MTIEITPEQHGIIIDSLRNRIDRLYRDSIVYRYGGNRVAQMDCLDEKKRVEQTLEYFNSIKK